MAFAPRVKWLFCCLGLIGLSIVGACASNCLQIQEQLCLCQGQTVEEQSTCDNNASTQESDNPPSNAQQAACARLLPGCTALIDGGSGCLALQTTQGKQICGLQALPDGG